MIKLFTVKDKAADVTNAPFPMQTKRDAIEAIRQLVNDPTTTIGKHPEDFELHYLGEYDEREMVALNWTPEFVINAKELKIQLD